MADDTTTETSTTGTVGTTESTETATSTWWKSKVLWLAVVGLGSAVASAVFGYSIDADTQTSIANLITSIVSAF